jgi:Fe/S biogenesis protein NfuA
MTSPLLTVTPDARAKIDSVRSSNDFLDALLRVKVAGRSGPRLQYEIALEDPRDRTDADLAVDLGGLTIVVDPDSADQLTGSTIDLDQNITGGGLRVDNPNEGWRDPLARAVQAVLDTKINPGVGGHGGVVSLIDVREGTAYMRFGGGCQGCAAVDVTLRAGVEAALREEVPEISAVVDVTDHAAGENPYYRHPA